MEKEGFFGDGGTRQVAREAQRGQVTLLEEVCGQTVPHALPCADM